jgi:hypothetical protein
MKNKRTKICGIVSFVLFFIAFILLFMWLITCDTENEIDTFIQGLFFLIISLIFGLIGIIKTQKESLGDVLCLPSICFSILIIIFYFLNMSLQNQ